MRGRRRPGRATGSTHDGQTMIEFAIASVVFLLIVVGTVDLGRSMYLYSQLNNGVREAAREAKVGDASDKAWSPSDIAYRVRVAKHPLTSAATDRPGLAGAVVTSTCTGGCGSGAQLTVSAELPFSAVTQTFLGLSPITLSASATVTME